jgi:hypothetical protein
MQNALLKLFVKKQNESVNVAYRKSGSDFLLNKDEIRLGGKPYF